MKLIAYQSEINPINLVGGKGHQLQKLSSWGAPVSPFLILTTEVYKTYLQTGIIPETVVSKVNDFFKSNPLVSVRSSMIGEDALDASFAGIFETFLNVSQKNWQENLLKVYSSIKSDRVQQYIEKKEIHQKLEMAVVIQQMIQCDVSGVLFTRSPLNPTAAIAIDVATGLGEGVVSGHVEVDHYQYTRSKDLIFQIKKYETNIISQSKLHELIDLALALEKKANVPSDIEWGMKDEKLYVFQMRPITRTFEPITYFVDTNLSESYPGTVSPFTGAFVKKAYENVFQESAVLLGAYGERLKTLITHYKKLISCVDNHLYYNLEHYYAVLRALPGGEKNIENWHRMIGGRIDSRAIPYHETKLNKFESFLSFFLLLKIAFRHKSIFTGFLKDLEELQSNIESEISAAKNPLESIQLLNSLIHRPLGFGLTVVNDIFIMIGLGILSKEIRKLGLPDDAVIDILKTSHGVDSIKPLNAFENVVKSLSEDFIKQLEIEKLRSGAEPYANAFCKLSNNGFSKEVQLLQKFLNEFGDRSFEELKLESLPLKNNPKLLLQLIHWGKKTQKAKVLNHKVHSGPTFGYFCNLILNFTKKAIAAREATRLWRGRFYHLIRSLVLKLSDQLQSEDSRWKEFETEDFFSLSHNEWLQFANGELGPSQVFDLFKQRANWKNNLRQYPETIIWVESEALPTFKHKGFQGDLAGQGVSPGMIESRALVLEKPDDALTSEMTDYILVTKNTDPAWVYIMSRSKGLISEKGSLLSHTAIIGRELSIPTIVGVKGATQKIKTGDLIRLDATKGKIEIL